MRKMTRLDVSSAPKRSFGAGSAIAQDLGGWYSEGDHSQVAGFLLGEKTDEDRDGSDTQLRDAICLLAGLQRSREAVMVTDEDGARVQVVSSKRGKPQFRDVPFSTRDRLEAMGILGIHERELSRDGTKRLVAIVFTNEEEQDEEEQVGPDEEQVSEDL